MKIVHDSNDDFIQLQQSTNDTILKCICFNAQSLLMKMDELFVTANALNPRITGVTELK